MNLWDTWRAYYRLRLVWAIAWRYLAFFAAVALIIKCGS